MSAIASPAGAAGGSVSAPRPLLGNYREWLWFAAAAALLLLGHLLERLGVAGMAGGYLFALSLLGLAMPRRLMEAFFCFVALGHREFTYLSLKIGPANLYITEWVLFILLLAAAPALPGVWRKYRPVLAGLGFYAGVGLLLLGLSMRYWPLGPAVRDFTIVYYALFVLAALAHLRDVRDVDRLFMAMAAGTLFNLVPDLLNYLYGTLPASAGQKNHSMRSSYYYVVCAAYLLPRLAFQERKLSLAPAVYVGLVFVDVLFFAYSKTAMGAIFLISIVSAAFMGKRLRVGALTAMIVVFLVALAGTPAGKTFKFSSLFALDFAGDDSRALLRTAAMRDFSEYPYGIGFGSPIFGRHSRELLGDTEQYHAVHNSYLTILRRMGIEGFAAFLILAGQACRLTYRMWRRRFTDCDAWLASFSVLMGFAGAAIFAMAHVALEGPFLGAAFWALFGALFVATSGAGADVAKAAEKAPS